MFIHPNAAIGHGNLYVRPFVFHCDENAAAGCGVVECIIDQIAHDTRESPLIACAFEFMDIAQKIVEKERDEEEVGGGFLPYVILSPCQTLKPVRLTPIGDRRCMVRKPVSPTRYQLSRHWWGDHRQQFTALLEPATPAIAEQRTQ